jgi:hypothetical protein
MRVKNTIVTGMAVFCLTMMTSGAAWSTTVVTTTNNPVPVVLVSPPSPPSTVNTTTTPVVTVKPTKPAANTTPTPQVESQRIIKPPASIIFKNDGLFFANFHGLNNSAPSPSMTFFNTGNIGKGSVIRLDYFEAGDSVHVTINYLKWTGSWNTLVDQNFTLKAGINYFRTSGATSLFNSPGWDQNRF